MSDRQLGQSTTPESQKGKSRRVANELETIEDFPKEKHFHNLHSNWSRPMGRHFVVIRGSGAGLVTAKLHHRYNPNLPDVGPCEAVTRLAQATIGRVNLYHWLGKVPGVRDAVES
jgi:hypothetical protein